MYTRQFFSFLSRASQEGFWSKWWHESRTCPNREKHFLLLLEIWQRKISKVDAMYAKRIFRILLLFAFVLNFTHKNKRSRQVFWVYHLRIFQGVEQQSSCPENVGWWPFIKLMKWICIIRNSEILFLIEKRIGYPSTFSKSFLQNSLYCFWDWTQQSFWLPCMLRIMPWMHYL
jgi:hypothetical protein